jgi:hypothetical protein
MNMSVVQHQNNTPIHGMFSLKPAQWHWGRSIRAGLCVGIPFAIGLSLHNIMPWMWLAMGTLMMTTGERQLPYTQRIVCLLGTSVMGAVGFLLGYLSLLPFGYTIAVMGVIGWLASLLSRQGPNWSIGCLQLLLIAAIAIGVPSIQHYVWPAVLYLLGAVIYVLVLGIEGLIVRARGQSMASPAPIPKENSTPSPAMALAVCLAAAYTAKYFIDTNHWFWVPLTVGLIMKPDLGNIVERSILRFIGTAGGVLIASVILSTVSKDVSLAIFIALLAAVLPWSMASSYALQALALTPLVLLLVDVIVPGPTNVNYGIQRLVDTFVGGVIAIVLGFLFWRLLDLFSRKDRSGTRA